MIRNFSYLQPSSKCVYSFGKRPWIVWPSLLTFKKVMAWATGVMLYAELFSRILWGLCYVSARVGVVICISVFYYAWFVWI